MPKPSTRFNIKVLSSQEFTYCPDELMFVSDVSNFDASDLFQRFYSDSIDLGFTMQSKSTGGLKDFVFRKEILSHDGECHGWEFVEADHPHLLSVIIFND